MKKFLLLVVMGTVSLLYGGCGNEIPIKEIVYVPIKDTINNEDNIKRIIYLEKTINDYKDSLNYLRDSLNEDLFIAKYKLARIREYNRIASKGNNIKYLRGWINRVLNE